MENKEDLLISSAIKLFWMYWPKKTSIDEIVKNAWVAKGTFYLYFKNKEEIFKKIIDVEFGKSEIMMWKLFENFPDIKERFVSYLVWSISYFKSNEIIRNMVLWNSNYYIWDINIWYLEKWHNKMLKILLKDSFWEESKNKIDDKKMIFLSKLIWNFKQILLIENKCFKTEKDFSDFVLDYAKVLVNWFFSDYENIWKKYDKKIVENIILNK